ncbi:hypothetical protein V8C34DRAFT_292461 [Trichoderma compactum]
MLLPLAPTSQRVSVLLTVWMFTPPVSSRLSCAAGTLPEFLGGAKLMPTCSAPHGACQRRHPCHPDSPTGSDDAIRGELNCG